MSRPLAEIEAAQVANWQRQAKSDRLDLQAANAYADAMAGHLQAAMRIAAEAAIAATHSAKRIDSGVTVVAKKGAATERAADLSRRVVDLHAAWKKTAEFRGAYSEASIAEHKASEAEREALAAEADAARAAEAEAEATRAAQNFRRWGGRS